VKRDSNRMHLEDIVKRVNEFTPRERLVVTLAIRGMLDKQVATALRIREIAVKASRCRAIWLEGRAREPVVVFWRRLLE